MGGTLDLISAARLVRGVGDALQAAHDAHVVHLDVKPSNVLLGRADWPLLADTGIAEVIEPAATAGKRRVAGTPQYMPRPTSTSTPTPTATLAPSVQRITLAPATGAIFIGQNLQMSATGLYSDGTQRDLTQVARWSSSDSSVISVNATGLISGQKSGTVTISASGGSVAGSMSIGCTAPLF